MYKYKFNYALKAFLGYQIYASYQAYKSMNEMTFMNNTQKGVYYLPIAMSSGAFAGACLLI